MAANLNTEDLTGKKFTMLTVLKESHRAGGPQSKRFWVCLCDCGNNRIVCSRDLIMERTKRCKSCKTKMMAETKLEHGEFKGDKRPSKLYSIWSSMKKRCEPNYTRTKAWYYDRGIRVCEDWSLPKMGYRNFKCWALANGYKEGLTLDRKDVNGNYCPENCRWATYKEQSLNRTDTIWLTIDGEKMNLYPAVEKFGNVVTYHAALSRLKRGWDHKRAVSEPLHPGWARRNGDEPI